HTRFSRDWSSDVCSSDLEERELLLQELVESRLGGIGAVDHIDDQHVPFLPVAVAAPDPLLDPLGVPRQVVVDEEVAELEVQPLEIGRASCREGGSDAEGG